MLKGSIRQALHQREKTASVSEAKENHKRKPREISEEAAERKVWTNGPGGCPSRRRLSGRTSLQKRVRNRARGGQRTHFSPAATLTGLLDFSLVFTVSHTSTLRMIYVHNQVLFEQEKKARFAFSKYYKSRRSVFVSSLPPVSSRVLLSKSAPPPFRLVCFFVSLL